MSSIRPTNNEEYHSARNHINRIPEDFFHFEDKTKEEQNPRKMYCSCGVAYKTRPYLNNHIRRSNKEMRFQCPECGLRVYAMSDLRIHLVHGHRKDLPRGATGCNLCGHLFPNNRDMIRHRKFGFCPVQMTALRRMGVIDSQPAQLGVGMLEVTVGMTGQGNGPSATATSHSADINAIPEGGATTSSLGDSAQGSDPGNGVKSPDPVGTPQESLASSSSASSDFGNYDYKKAEDLIQHFKDTLRSAQDSKHYCNCGRQFSKEHELNHHIRRETDEWKFKCDQCGQRFFEMFRFKKHCETFHKQHVPKGAGCTGCGQMFPTRLSLGKHRRYGICRTTKVTLIDLKPGFKYTI